MPGFFPTKWRLIFCLSFTPLRGPNREMWSTSSNQRTDVGVPLISSSALLNPSQSEPRDCRFHLEARLRKGEWFRRSTSIPTTTQYNIWLATSPMSLEFFSTKLIDYLPYTRVLCHEDFCPNI
jgi:hypothetical protein